jgi:DNA-directed RNA polymerase specialized sigma24 family protein
MDIRLSALAIDLLASGASIVSRSTPGVTAGDIGSGISDRTPESDCIQAQAEAIASDVIDGCLSGLTDEHHDVIVMRIWHDLTFAEIGFAFDITESAARRLYMRALERLRLSFSLIGYTSTDVLM